MDAEGDPQFAHSIECRAKLLDIEPADAPFAVGGDTGGIEFDRGELFGQRGEKVEIIFRFEKKGHVGLENFIAHGLKDPLPVSTQHLSIGDRRDQIGHDQSPAKAAGAERCDGSEHGSVAQVQMHIEGFMQDDLSHRKPLG